MSLTQKLAREKAAITGKWFELIIHSYPPDTARFLEQNKDPFANPVGRNTRQSLEILIDLLTGEFIPEKARAAMDTIIRIRAIQNFTPAKAVRFIFDLKRVLRDAAGDAVRDPRSARELLDLDHRIDELALTAFDLYMQCREKIFELKANEVKSKTFKAFARAGLIKEPTDDA